MTRYREIVPRIELLRGGITVVPCTGPVWAKTIDHTDQLVSRYTSPLRVADELGVSS